MLGNDATIYDLVNIYGCAIGGRAKIGAHATQDVPDGSVIAGNPMRIVERKQ